jgi:hypothetical protein
MKRAFEDPGRWLAAYDRGEYCHSPIGGGPGAALYGESAIPEAYVRSRWTDRFEISEYINDTRRCFQNVIVARKPE